MQYLEYLILSFTVAEFCLTSRTRPSRRNRPLPLWVLACVYRLNGTRYSSPRRRQHLVTCQTITREGTADVSVKIDESTGLVL